MGEKDFDALLKEFRVALSRVSPLLSFHLTSCDVRLVNEESPWGAKTDGEEIIIYSNAVKDLRMFSRYLIRSLIHSLMGHPWRAGKLLRIYGEDAEPIIRFAAGVVASRLTPKRLRLEEHSEAFLSDLIGEDYASLSLEKVVERLMEDKGRLSQAISRGGDGSFDIKDGNLKDLDEQIERVKENLRRLSTVTKMFTGAGTEEVGELRKIIEEMLKEPPLRWNLILRRFLQGFERKHLISTWQMTNRKNDELPGHKWFARPRIFVCVDVSGSISDEEYSLFVREIVGMAKFFDVHFVSWDVKAKHHGLVKKPEDMKKRVSDVSGYGGTTITCLKGIFDKHKVGMGDLIIVLSDAGWFEGDDEVQSFFKKYRCPKVLVLSKENYREYESIFDLVVSVRGDM